mgnify:FL=1
MTSNTASGTNSYLQITPSNVLSNGKISFRNGNPVVQFLISPQERYLIGSSVRLTGNVRFFKSPDNIGDAVSEISINSRLGVYSLIDQLNIKAGSGPATGQTIEHIRHYNRMMASYLAGTSGFQDSQGSLQETALTLPNFDLANKGATFNDSAEGNSFAVALPCGLFNGQNPIPLWMTGGLLIEISLSPDNNCLFAENGTTTAIENAFYEFTDLNLLCETMDVPSNIRNSIGKSTMTFNYNSIHSYFTTINSTNAIVNFNLNLKNVLGVFGNFIEASKINNLAFDGMSCLEPTNKTTAGVISSAPIQKIIWTRGGEKMPFSYDLNFLQRNNLDNKFIDPMVSRGYLNAITQFANNPGRIQASPVNTQYGGEQLINATQSRAYLSGKAFGIGCALDQISDVGVDYSQTNFGINMNLNLVTNNPVAFYMYAHARNTLVLNANGLQILS